VLPSRCDYCGQNSNMGWQNNGVLTPRSTHTHLNHKRQTTILYPWPIWCQSHTPNLSPVLKTYDQQSPTLTFNKRSTTTPHFGQDGRLWKRSNRIFSHCYANASDYLKRQSLHMMNDRWNRLQTEKIYKNRLMTYDLVVCGSVTGEYVLSYWFHKS
jgi:hypothetical protein